MVDKLYPVLMDVNDQADRWDALLHSGEDGPASLFSRAALARSVGGHVTVTFSEVWSHDAELGLYLVGNPRKALREMRDAFKAPVHVRGVPAQTSLRQIGSAQMGGLVSVRGVVVKASEDQSRIVTASYVCQSCGASTVVRQRGKFLNRPDEPCASCEGKKFDLDPERCTYRDAQTITVQETSDQLPHGEVPQRVDVELVDECVKSAYPGDVVEVTGIVSTRMQTPYSFKLELDRIIDASHVEVLNKQFDAVKISAEDEATIREMSRDPAILDRFIRSFAPSIYGYEYIKEAIVLQLFGSQAEQKQDVRIRGDIHCLIVGDPASGKSQLLKIAVDTSPRGVFAAGGRSSKAGLTATVIKDEKLGGYSLEAGSFVLADMGLLALDEAEKMDKGDRAAIHPAMEQQVIDVNLAGISAKLNARCSVLAAANPTAGRWNPYQTVAQNISGFPDSLLSRFDLIFIVIDKPEEGRDRATAQRMMGLDPGVADLISRDLMKKYISYSKRVNPTLPDAMLRDLSEFYVAVRRGSDSEAAVMYTPRQLESLRRITRAVARVHLREVCIPSDLEEAKRLFGRSMQDVGVDPETGIIDLDLVNVGRSRTSQGRMREMLDAVTRIKKSLGGVCREGDVAEELRGKGWTDKEFKDVRDALLRDGVMYCPRPGYLSTT